jgi:tetratricopeptide (TPR) repeat protein
MMTRVVLAVLLLSVSTSAFAATPASPTDDAEQKLILKASGEGLTAQMALLDNNPQKAQIHFNRSIGFYDQAIELDPRNLRARLDRGLMKDIMRKGAGTKDVEQAIDLANELIIEYPDEPDLYYLRGSAYRHLKRYDRAEEDLSKAVYLNPGRESWQTDLKAVRAITGG